MWPSFFARFKPVPPTVKQECNGFRRCIIGFIADTATAKAVALQPWWAVALSQGAHEMTGVFVGAADLHYADKSAPHTLGNDLTCPLCRARRPLEDAPKLGGILQQPPTCPKLIGNLFCLDLTVLNGYNLRAIMFGEARDR